jgi:peptide/nickel transport system permease protein
MVLGAGTVLSLAIMSVNLVGDAVRDALDPRMAKRGIDR